MLGAGRFRISLAEPAQDYAGFHITFSANQYEDAEHHTPRITPDSDFPDVVIKLKRKKITVEDKRVKVGEGFRGKVMHQGKPVSSGVVTLCRMVKDMNVINGYVLRGRVTTPAYMELATTTLEHGSYEIAAYSPGKYFLTIYLPGEAPTITDVVSLGSGEWKQFDINTRPPGSIAGSVKDIPAEAKGYLWVVAFNKTGYRAETSVDNKGAFHFRALPPGDYGLKVGHDGMRDHDAEVPFPQNPDQKKFEEYKKKADAPSNPWLRAKEVKVESLQAVKDLVLEVPVEAQTANKK